MSGKIVHFEIPFDDGERARTFYADAFGWSIDEMPELDYTIVTTGPVADSGMPADAGYINGGMYQRSTEAPHPVVTIDVPSIDDALKTVESLGGKTVTGRTPVADMGVAAYFTDTEGNIVGLWENAAPA